MTDTSELIEIWKETKESLFDFENESKRSQFNTYYNQSELDKIYSGKIPSTNSINPIISVVNDNPLEVVRNMVNEGHKTILMNPSRPYSFGGGVNRGLTNLEAEIYRRTTLSTHINNSNEYMYYPLSGKKGILSKKVIVFRDINYKYLNEQSSYFVDIFTLALPDNPQIRSINYEDFYAYPYQEKTVEEIIQLFFEVAFLNTYSVVVLTDIGCREQNHPTELIAKIIKQQAHKYRYYFDKIIIAVEGDIYDANDKYSLNYERFKYIFDNQNTSSNIPTLEYQDDELC